MSDNGFAHYNNEETKTMIENGYVGNCILFVNPDGFSKMVSYSEFKARTRFLHDWDKGEVLLSSISKQRVHFRSHIGGYQFKLIRPSHI